jgi:hypothetical protein
MYVLVVDDRAVPLDLMLNPLARVPALNTQVNLCLDLTKFVCVLPGTCRLHYPISSPRTSLVISLRN